jgi:hypothetical protein
MKYVYVAGPYTRGDPVANTAKVIEVADKLVRWGFIPYVPHLTLFWHFLFPHEISFWYRYDNAWLKKCDILLRLEGESSGADAEVELAKMNGLRVYYSTAELLLRESIVPLGG